MLAFQDVSSPNDEKWACITCTSEFCNLRIVSFGGTQGKELRINHRHFDIHSTIRSNEVISDSCDLSLLYIAMILVNSKEWDTGSKSPNKLTVEF